MQVSFIVLAPYNYSRIPLIIQIRSYPDNKKKINKVLLPVCHVKVKNYLFFVDDAQLKQSYS